MTHGLDSCATVTLYHYAHAKSVGSTVNLVPGLFAVPNWAGPDLVLKFKKEKQTFVKVEGGNVDFFGGEKTRFVDSFIASGPSVLHSPDN